MVVQEGKPLPHQATLASPSTLLSPITFELCKTCNANIVMPICKGYLGMTVADKQVIPRSLEAIFSGRSTACTCSCNALVLVVPFTKHNLDGFLLVPPLPNNVYLSANLKCIIAWQINDECSSECPSD